MMWESKGYFDMVCTQIENYGLFGPDKRLSDVLSYMTDVYLLWEYADVKPNPMTIGDTEYRYLLENLNERTLQRVETPNGRKGLYVNGKSLFPLIYQDIDPMGLLDYVLELQTLVSKN